MVPPTNGGDVGYGVVPDEVLAMPGYEILQSAQHLGRVLGILLGNAAELQRYFDTLNAPTDPNRMLGLWDPRNRDAFDAHLNEAERLLFNFLAACYSRVEFYRVLVNKDLIVGQLRTEYDRRVTALDSTPLHRWLFGLRRLMQHHALPVSSGTLTTGFVTPPANIDVAMIAPKSPGHRVRELFVEGGGTPALLAIHQDATGHARETALSYAWGIGVTRAGMIDLAHLRRRHPTEFRGAAKAYMEGRNEQDVLEAVADYLALVTEFDTWFGEAYVRDHLDEAEAFLGARNTAGQQKWTRRLEPPQDQELRGPSVPPSEADS